MNYYSMTFLQFFILVWIFSSGSCDSNEYKSYKDYKLYSINSSFDKRINNLIQKLKRFDVSLPYDSNAVSTQILVNPNLVSEFKEIATEENLEFELSVEDYSSIIASEKEHSGPGDGRSNGFSWTSYYDIDDIYAYLTNTSITNSNWTELIVGGESYEGRKILGLRIDTPINDDKRKPVIFIESGIHAREWIAPATTTYFINQLLTSENQDIIDLRNQFDWRIFPTVNPDGYHYSYNIDRMWRKTRSKSENGCYGADPNRNWDYNWLKYGTSNNPCDYQTYGGLSAFSEIETRSLATYISSIENLLGYVAFHADAQMLLVPYSDSTEHEDNYNDLVRIGNRSLEYGYQVNKAKYDGPATAAEILYKASGGSMDWVRYNLSIPLVFTYELRGLWFQWPAALIYQQGDEYTQMMLGLVSEARALGYF